MHDVSNAINILDSSKGVDKAICKGKYDSDDADGQLAEREGKCGLVKTSGNGTKAGLSNLWEAKGASNGGGNYDKAGTDKMGNHTSATISKDTAALTREQKGVVSSAFAKAHEGARYTSMMYIYDQEEYA